MRLQERSSRAESALRLILATIISLCIVGFGHIIVMGEMPHVVSEPGSLARFSLDRILLVVLWGAGVAMCYGAVTAAMAAPHSARIPAAIVAVFLFLLGLAVYASERELISFITTFVAPPAYLLGVEIHARTLRRKELKKRYETRARAGAPPKVGV